MSQIEMLSGLEEREDAGEVGLGPLWNKVLSPLASLKLTVALFAVSIFLVLAGTLAQVEKDIWQVIDEYFRGPVAFIEYQIFIPPSFWKSLTDRPVPSIPGGFYFVGGWTIGALMALNLLAAHLIRFRVQASGWRLVSGLLTILVGMLITAVIVVSGNASHGLQTESIISYRALWWLMVAGLAGSGVLSAVSWYRIPPSQTLTRRLLAVAVLGQAIVVGYLVSRGDAGRLSDSAMRILWQLTQGTVAGGVLLVGCQLVFQKRAGIVLLHGGIGLMMLSELLVGLTAVEGQIPLVEGETANFVQDIRTVELAVVDRSDPKTETVTVIPRSVLVAAATSKVPIDDPRLPFRVRVDEFLQNSQMRERRPSDASLATAGNGLKWIAEEVRPGSGTDTDSRVDLSATYVTLLPKIGESPLGTYLLGLFFSVQDGPETVKIDDNSYQVSLRFKRMYRPYRIQLIDVRKDDYLGTDTPRNYSSDVRVVDETRQVDREVKIWMNNPLRFAGETFYQSGYQPGTANGPEGSTLQVVTNTGWMIPYVSCMIVAVGLLYHFGITLSRFLQKTERSLTPQRTSSTANSAWSTNEWAECIVPCVVGVVCVAGVLAEWRPPTRHPEQFHLDAFGELPVVSEGRSKPFDTLARTSLQVISGKQSFVDKDDERQPAIRWLLDVMAKPQRAAEHPVFYIPNFDVQHLLGLEPRKGYRYALVEFLPKIQALSGAADKARERGKENITLYDRAVLDLEKKIGTFDLLLRSFQPPDIRPDNQQADLMQAIAQQEQLESRHPPLTIPSVRGEGDWTTFAQAWTMNLVKSQFLRRPVDPQTELFTTLLVSYSDQNPKEFNKTVAAYRSWLSQADLKEVKLTKAEFEAAFNRAQPFFTSQLLYLLAFKLAVLGWMLWPRGLQRSALTVAVVALMLHTFALVARMYISGRPPVTNLYSSAVFIGWGCVVLGLSLNFFFRNGMGTVLAAVLGWVTLGIADILATDGDTFVVLQAVLDTQFWLATHVTCITMGYATTYLAGLLGVVYVLSGVCTPYLTASFSRDLYRMTYGVLCFSIFFSFVGTVLGGLWADDSWGRFWGWDPKENGALIIVLWNALCLHARWGGMVKERGLALLSIAGNICVSWSWFGVNELGVGLHAYGFREGMVFWLGVFALSQLALIALGSLPRSCWWSQPGKEVAAVAAAPRPARPVS
jgi:ABC-type transport system involved in cytochrome c biogenesis permease subunit